MIKYQNIFAKDFAPNLPKEDFVIKNTVQWTYFIRDFNAEEIVGGFYEKEMQKEKSKRV